MTTVIGGSYPSVNSDSDATINGLTVGKGTASDATNTVVGNGALAANTTGSRSVAIGQNALAANTTGNRTVAIGFAALATNTTGEHHIAIGSTALNGNTTGSYSVAVGREALVANTTGSNNTAIGNQTLQANTTASNNTAVGYQASYANTTASWTTAVGYQSLKDNTTGRNTALGAYSLWVNTTGTQNTALGDNALTSNTTGSSNTAQGFQALSASATTNYNTAVGWQSFYLFNRTADANGYNTGIGIQTGYSTTTGNFNTFLGQSAGYNNTTGSINSYLGTGAGSQMTTGSKNVIVGSYTGNAGGLDIRTASNYIVLSDGDGNPKVIHNGNTLIAAGSSTSAYGSRVFQVNAAVDGIFGTTMQYTSSGGSPQILQLYLSAQAPNNTGSVFIESSDTGALRFQVRSNGGIANFSGNNVNLSDAREKTNVELAGSYLDKICAIPVKTFNYIDQNRDEDDGLTLGVIAQDVQAVAPELVMESNWAGKNEPEKMRLSIYQTDLQYALMKAIQELNAKVEAQALEIEQLKGN